MNARDVTGARYSSSRVRDEAEAASASPAPPRRLTATWVIERLTEHRQAAPKTATFEIAQVKAVGGAVVNEWTVNVPVSEEHPTSDEAFAAAARYAAELTAAYPPPAPAPDDKPAPKGALSTRQAAAIGAAAERKRTK